MKVYSLKCKSLKIYNVPFVASDDGHAVATVREAIKRDQQGERCIMNLEDLSLFCLGEFDSKDGIKHARPKLITDLLSIPGIKIVQEVVQDVAQSN